jgi:hypothetical protein
MISSRATSSLAKAPLEVVLDSTLSLDFIENLPHKRASNIFFFPKGRELPSALY